MSRDEEWEPVSFDPITGYIVDPRDQHPAGKGRAFRFKTGESTRSSVDYYPGFRDWLEYGILTGFCSPPSCARHEATPCTDQEYDRIEVGEDLCLHEVRLFPVGGGGPCATMHGR